MDARLEREKAFHDELFGSGSERPADAFYVICRESFRYYEDLIYGRGAGRQVLELGCGPSSYAVHLAARNAQVTGVDISEVAVAESRARSQRSEISDRVDFQVMDAENLDLDGDTFELICGSGVLHHLDLGRACASICSHLRPDGTAVFMEPMGHNPAINAYRRLTPAQRSPDEHPLRIDDLQLISRHFGSVRVRYFHLAALLALAARRRSRFGAILGQLEGLDRLMLRRLGPLGRHAWVTVLDMAQPRVGSATLGLPHHAERA